MKHTEYSALDYPVEIRRLPEEEGGGYIACIPMLGRWTVQAVGDTLEETLQLLEEVKDTVFAHLQERGFAIPEPPPLEEPKQYQGKIVLRVPPVMHEELIHRAEQEGCSLNQFIQNALSRYLGGLQAMETVWKEWGQKRASAASSSNLP
ncbi:MAG: YlcI/YnfO family protein [Armatimonadota bacterium]|nr:type II toxin-antitoxin system HicB family antitoxin [bacterium]MDW8321227.1 YlcI/YnfO family protein [Armatimonadota bacterium]